MKETVGLCIETTKNLRSAYYKTGKAQNNYDSVPFGGSIRESIGPFPEFIMKGRFCKRSLKGYCSPCFYSRLPEHNVTDNLLNQGYLEQVDYIIENFDELVINNQIGKVAFPQDNTKACGMVCTPTGSYFDEVEYPLSVRKDNLNKIYNVSVKKNCVIALHIESHAEDVITYFQNPDFEEIKLLQKLNTRVILGFESVNELSRNVNYAKNLDLQTFEKAVKVLKEHGFPVGAFVFAGLFAMTEQETIDDTNSSFEYLKKLEVTPVLMFANTQKYTIPDVLMSIGKYKLLDPRTVCTIVQNMIDIFGCDMTGNIDPWLIADPKGGPPDPNLHIFNSPQSTACSSCASRTYEAIERLRITKDPNKFREECAIINACNCKLRYNELLIMQEKIGTVDRIKRIQNAIFDVNNNIEAYVLRESPWLVKAELLCYGLKLSNEQFNLAEKINPFIREKGFIHAVHIKYENIIINVCVSEKFCQLSPYHVDVIDSKWHLYKNGFDLGMFDFLPMPEWIHQRVGNKMIGSIIRPHTNKCVSLWPSTICSYVQRDLGCKFCCLNTSNNKDVASVQEIVDALYKVLDFNPQYEINLSGGTCGNPDTAIAYLSAICSLIRKKHKAPISVECAPPSSADRLLQLKRSGVTSIIMNIEVFDEKLRRSICPGKSENSIAFYMDMLQKSVEIFGRGNVSSVLIVGIQPDTDIRAACKKLVSTGVIPTLIPFKPLDDTPMENYPIVSPERYIALSKYLAVEMGKNHLCISCNSGCASCGACSLEINLNEVL